jgi:hypothetical protein
VAKYAAAENEISAVTYLYVGNNYKDNVRAINALPVKESYGASPGLIHHPLPPSCNIILPNLNNRFTILLGLKWLRLF